MDDSTFIKWALGVITLLGATLLRWTHLNAQSAHVKIDEFENKLVKHNDRMTTCRQTLEKDMHTLSRELMTETQVKDFVDRSIKPLTDSIKAVDNKISEKHRELMKEIKRLK